MNDGRMFILWPFPACGKGGKLPEEKAKSEPISNLEELVRICLLWMGARGIRRFGQLTQSLGKRLKTRADGPKNGPLKAKGLQSSVYKDSILKPHILYPANGFRTGSFNIRLSGRLYSSFGVMNLLYRKQVPETSPCPGRGTGG